MRQSLPASTRFSQCDSPGSSRKYAFRAFTALVFSLGGWLALCPPAVAQYFENDAWGPLPPRRRLELDQFINGAPSPDVVYAPNVARTLNARGFRLIAPPERDGDRIIAIGESRIGARVRFVIDAYSGRLLRMNGLRETSGRNYSGGRFDHPLREREYEREVELEQPDFPRRERGYGEYGPVNRGQWGGANRNRQNPWDDRDRGDRTEFDKRARPDDLTGRGDRLGRVDRENPGVRRPPQVIAPQVIAPQNNPAQNAIVDGGRPAPGRPAQSRPDTPPSVRPQAGAPQTPAQASPPLVVTTPTGATPPASAAPPPVTTRPSEIKSDIGPRVQPAPATGAATAIPTQPAPPAPSNIVVSPPRAHEMHDAQVPR